MTALPNFTKEAISSGGILQNQIESGVEISETVASFLDTRVIQGYPGLFRVIQC